MREIECVSSIGSSFSEEKLEKEEKKGKGEKRGGDNWTHN